MSKAKFKPSPIYKNSISEITVEMLFLYILYYELSN